MADFQLLACPFCGSAAETVVLNGCTAVACKQTVTCGHRGAYFPRPMDAIEGWNRRAGPIVGGTTPIHWRCFHCNLIARSTSEAIGHFGPPLSSRKPQCLARCDAVVPRLMGLAVRAADHGNHTDAEVLMEAADLLCTSEPSADAALKDATQTQRQDEPKESP